MWKQIDGYRYPYRINEEAVVQRQLKDGSWQTLGAYFQGGRGAAGRLAVRMTRAPKQYETRFVVDLMVDAFLGGMRPPGKVLTHRNGMRADCSLENLVWTTPSAIGKRYGGSNRRSVEKVDRRGHVVALYRSISEAAECEHCHRKAIIMRCRNQLHTNPFLLTGYTYRYERVI